MDNSFDISYTDVVWYSSMSSTSQDLNFETLNEKAKKLANLIIGRKQEIVDVLTRYETYWVAMDEIDRSLDLLLHLNENCDYFVQEIRGVATFLPSNQPLYAFSCFAVVPALMAKQVYVKAPEVMKSFFFDLVKVLEIKEQFPNILISEESREDFVTRCSSTKLDYTTNKQVPIIDAVIFTGTTHNANLLRRRFGSDVLFIMNGAGHNPVVVSETADIPVAVESVLRLQTYNQGQDCAAPNSILVHVGVYDLFMSGLREKVKQIKIGDYADPTVDIGPITRSDSISVIESLITKNMQWLDISTEGTIHLKSRVVEPTIITRPLRKGGNYTEVFAPVFFIQKYEADFDLALYFEDPLYAPNAMYVTIFGESAYVNSLLDKKLSSGEILHDASTIIRNTDLHAPGIERGVKPYGGYGRGASSLSLHGTIISLPTLPQRDLYEYIVCKKEMVPLKSKKEQRLTTAITKPLAQISEGQHWADRIVDHLLEMHPALPLYTCAAGISPSGTIHFGNFRDVATAYAVEQRLVARGKKTRLVFFWDDFDRFRKVPQGIDLSFEQHIGKPLSAVPCPLGKYSSYAERYEREFENSMHDLGIEVEFQYQTHNYQSGMYDDLIRHALQHRKEIADILLSFMTEKGKTEKSIEPNEYREHYYPISVYSRFSGKDNTRITHYDEDTTITYTCFDTGKSETIDFTRDRIVKLAWKVDWPMRWKKESIIFEPGGQDHASPGGSYDTSKVIADRIFSATAPIFQEYGFVGIQGLGSKMSGSKGNSISPAMLLQIYTPELLKWMYISRSPLQMFELSFGTDIYKQYSEYDNEVQYLREGKISDMDHVALILSGVSMADDILDIPFRQAVGFGQIIQWDSEKLSVILDNMELKYRPKSIKERLPRARAWLETYNEEGVFGLLSTVNKEYYNKMNNLQHDQVQALRELLQIERGMNIGELEERIYDIPKREGQSVKERATAQKAFFQDVYNLLIGRDMGPRLSTFLWAADREKTLTLLSLD